MRFATVDAELTKPAHSLPVQIDARQRTWNTRVAGCVAFPFLPLPFWKMAGPSASDSCSVLMIGAISRAEHILQCSMAATQDKLADSSTPTITTQREV